MCLLIRKSMCLSEDRIPESACQQRMRLAATRRNGDAIPWWQTFHVTQHRLIYLTARLGPILTARFPINLQTPHGRWARLQCSTEQASFDHRDNGCMAFHTAAILMSFLGGGKTHLLFEPLFKIPISWEPYGQSTRVIQSDNSICRFG